MRRVPHAVAIITASSDTPTQASEKTFRGMTVSSFNTVTLSPTPVVAFNVRRPSETLNALQSSARFCVHLLASTDATARLARDFSRGNENLHLSAEDKGEFEFAALPSRRSDGAGGLDELPLLRRKTRGAAAAGGGANEQPVDFPFVFECEYLPDKAVEIHDHIIVLGRVVRVHLAPESASASRSEAKSGTGSIKDLCLTYADARFWKMGEEI
jgi:flavin reductase (DIM6/NTAB) family NADH-FMN oxidoreductase RutF